MFKVNLNFEEYVKEANAAETKEELFSIYSKTVSQHGLDRVLLCLATDHKDIGETAGMNFMHNYPEDWMKHYFQNGFDKIDPVMIYSLDKYSSFKWSDIPRKMQLVKKQKTCLLLGEEAGLNHGVCTPLRGPNHAIAGLSLASSEKKDAFDGNVDIINAYSNHFYIAYRRIGEKAINQDEHQTPNIALTEKERETLLWMSKGKSDSDIACILGMSRHTINFHKRNIYKKLDCNEKTLAVVKAITCGLIQP